MERMITQRIKKNDGTIDAIAVAGVVDVYSHSEKIDWGKSFCLSIKATVASGTPDIDLYIEQSHVEQTDAMQGDASDATNGMIAIEGSSKLLDITNENWHHLTISPAVLPYLRFKLSGQGANPASCTVQMYLTQLQSLDY